MSVEPWMFAWPRRARMPPPGRPMLPSSSCSTAEARVDVDHLRAALLGLDHPLEADRVLLGHVRAHDQDAVGVLQVLLERRGATAAERGPQTGDRGGVSYAGLVLDRHRAERREALLDQVVLLGVQRGAAEERHAQRAVERV